eukprot:352965-Chlamydomonas_euryale.AAC.12
MRRGSPLAGVVLTSEYSAPNTFAQTTTVPAHAVASCYVHVYVYKKGRTHPLRMDVNALSA